MPDFKNMVFCKAITVFLCFFLAFYVHTGFPQPLPQVDQQEMEALTGQFNTAKDAYFAEDYATGKNILENLISALEEKDGLDTMKGEAYLLLGATYEKLGYNLLAMKFYCLAKEKLGDGKSIEGLELRLLKYYTVTCFAPSGIAVYVLIDQYQGAYAAYFAEDYEGAKVILENLVAEVETLRGWDSFKGETYLLLGATYEKLKYKELSINYYCKAKAILGEGKTIRGLVLSKLRWYKVKCAGVAGVAVAPRPRQGGGFGKLLGTLIGLAILGGLVWYLFFSPNAPLGPTGDYTSITVRVEVEYKGLNGKGVRKLWINNVEKLNENFSYPQDADANSSCSDATKIENRGPWTYTSSSGQVTLKELWDNWDYFTHKSGGVLNRKVICTSWTVTIDSYEWDKGRDPGTPVVNGLNNLTMDINSDCTDLSFWVTRCENEGVLTFSTPAEFGKKSSGVYKFDTYSVVKR